MPNFFVYSDAQCDTKSICRCWKYPAIPVLVVRHSRVADSFRPATDVAVARWSMTACYCCDWQPDISRYCRVNSRSKHAAIAICTRVGVAISQSPSSISVNAVNRHRTIGAAVLRHSTHRTESTSSHRFTTFADQSSLHRIKHGVTLSDHCYRIADLRQAWYWTLSVCLSVRPSVCHTLIQVIYFAQWQLRTL